MGAVHPLRVDIFDEGGSFFDARGALILPGDKISVVFRLRKFQEKHTYGLACLMSAVLNMKDRFHHSMGIQLVVPQELGNVLKTRPYNLDSMLEKLFTQLSKFKTYDISIRS